MDLNQNFNTLSDSDLSAYQAQIRAALDALMANDTPSEAEVTQAESYADHIDAISAEQTARVEKAQQLASRRDALRNRFGHEDGGNVEDPAKDPAEANETEPLSEPQPAQGAEVDAQREAEEDDSEAPKNASRGGVTTLARKTQRPVAPAPSRAPVVITAAADVPDFSTGARLDMNQVAEATLSRMKGFTPPVGDGSREDLRQFGVASFRMDFPKELTIDRHSDDLEVLNYATSEARLQGGSLVAAGGWCAPSETLYDLCTGETTDGMISVPEVNVKRGGIKYTRGPDFSTIYSSVGFVQTEAQAISGTTKPCFEVPCPPFVEVRLDAIGLCIKVPILTNAAYPELVQRWLTGAMVAHQHKVNARVIASIASGSTAKTAPGIGAVATDTWDALTLYASQTRQKYRLAINSTLEVVLPYWVKEVMRSDISRRTGVGADQVTDQQIAAGFAVRKLNVQYVYDWQDLPYADVVGPPAIDADKWPTTFDALLYPAGAWVKGTSDIINLNAVYDAASLAVNTYTGLFFEEGILVAPQCYDSMKVTIPVCAGGRTGVANLTCS